MLGLLALPIMAQDDAFRGLRPPAVPLIACDPYFSVWSAADRLTDAVTTHWTGKPQPLNSLIRVDGKAYRLMGRQPGGTPALAQSSVRVLPTRTVYEFAGAGVKVRLTFMTPMLPDDLDVLARPVTYITWDVNSTDGAQHRVALFFDAAASLAVNDPAQEVTMGLYREDGNEVLRAGSKEQKVLQRWGDDVRIDWGFLYVAAPQSENGRAALTIASTARSTRSSSQITSIFTFGRKSTTYSAPRYSSVWPFWRPKPLAATTVMPCRPTSCSASFTSSSLKGLMIASIFFMRVKSPAVCRASSLWGCPAYADHVNRQRDRFARVMPCGNDRVSPMCGRD